LFSFPQNVVFPAISSVNGQCGERTKVNDSRGLMFEKGGFQDRRAYELLKSTAWYVFNVAPENVNVNSKPVGATGRYPLTFPDTNQWIVNNTFQELLDLSSLVSYT